MNRECWFQLEIIVPSMRDKHPRETYLNSSLRNFNTDRKIKVADDLPPVPKLTIFRRAKDHKTAERSGRKLGTVISCFKVDRYPYLERKERINLEEKPLWVEVREEEFTVSKDLEISRATNGENNLNISVDK